jgi:hypothetical protein
MPQFGQNVFVACDAILKAMPFLPRFKDILSEKVKINF